METLYLAIIAVLVVLAAWYFFRGTGGQKCSADSDCGTGGNICFKSKCWSSSCTTNSDCPPSYACNSAGNCVPPN